ncbi:MAG: hypothetical protein HY279_09470 [Nitrospinae bacterium]|nr:hypothetical protein [Nitrospinota bacterium]
MKISDWNNMRAKLHHDWLQRYFVFLNARSAQFNDIVKGNAKWQDDIKEQFLEWQERGALFKTLINECEEALSPRQLLYEPPLVSMSQEDKDWLGNVIHALYLERTGIRKMVYSLNAIFFEVNTAFKGIVNGRADKPSPSGHFINRLTEFSSGISKLPHNIQVV